VIDDFYDVIVVGSGPTGLAAAFMASSMNKKVLMVDIGMVERANTAQLKSNLRDLIDNKKNFSSARKEYLQQIRKNDPRLKSHVGSKTHFGDDFSYTEITNIFKGVETPNRGIPMFSSTARGGLSNVWGSICSPFPIGSKYDFKFDGFKMLEGIIRLAASSDALDDVYGPPIEGGHASLNPSKLAQSILDRYEALRDRKAVYNLRLGKTRVAVNNDSGVSSCVYCGLCTIGCPRDAIWNSRFKLNELRERKNFTYQPGQKILQINDHGSFVSVTSETGRVFSAHRVFLALGSINSIVLLLQSGILKEEVRLLDTQLVVVPTFSKRRTSFNEPAFTLSNLIGSYFEPALASRAFIQFTTPAFDFSSRVLGRFKFLKVVPKWFLNEVVKWTSVTMIFLPDKISGFLQISRGVNGSVKIDLVPRNAETCKILVKRICQQFRIFRVLPVSTFAQYVGVTESYHVGSARNVNGDCIFDENGQVESSKRIHVVDTCALSELHAGPITYVAMANAAKIAKVACEAI